MSYQPAKVERTLMINGSPAKNYSDDDLVALVAKEQEAAETLGEIKPPSEHIAARIDNHEAAAKAIIEVLDTRKVKPLNGADDEGQDDQSEGE